MRNVHERHIEAPAAAVGAVLETLASDADRLWPRHLWPAMQLDRGLAVGSSGGHDDVRYHVTAHEPGVRVEFAFDGPGLVGTHAFEVHDRGDGTATLRHVIVGRTEGAMRLLWPLVVRWVHDAVAEDALDCAERSVGVGPARPATWSPYIRLLRRVRERMDRRAQVREIDTPSELLIAAALPRVDFDDTFAVLLPAGASEDVRVWHRVLTDAGLPPWVHALLRVRNVLARAMRLDTAAPTEEASPLRPLRHDGETLVFGVDDRHLDFRGVLRVVAAGERARLEFATVVRKHNAAGRAYFALVRPFHRRVVPAMLRRAVAYVPPARGRTTVSA